MKRAKGIHDDITKAAYDLFEKRGGAHGHDVNDWIEAEKTVMENRERHSYEVQHEVYVAVKPTAGFRQTVKKEGWYKKG